MESDASLCQVPSSFATAPSTHGGDLSISLTLQREERRGVRGARDKNKLTRSCIKTIIRAKHCTHESLKNTQLVSEIRCKIYLIPGKKALDSLTIKQTTLNGGNLTSHTNKPLGGISCPLFSGDDPIGHFPKGTGETLCDGKRGEELEKQGTSLNQRLCKTRHS